MTRGIVAATLAALLLTKLADCVSTQLRISDAAGETNPGARRLMRRFGVRRVIWAYGALAAAIACVAALPALVAEAPWYAAAYVALGVPIALVQAEVARTNLTGRAGPLARRVAGVHARAGRRRS